MGGWWMDDGWMDEIMDQWMVDGQNHRGRMGGWLGG